MEELKREKSEAGTNPTLLTVGQKNPGAPALSTYMPRTRRPHSGVIIVTFLACFCGVCSSSQEVTTKPASDTTLRTTLPGTLFHGNVHKPSCLGR